MKKIFLILLLIPHFSLASEIYINGNRVVLALESIHGIGAGVGGKTCLLCHNSGAGGDGNINPGFGQDFVDTALDVIGTRGGDGIPATGPNSLESIFSDADFAATDSDRDGRSNAEEFVDNTDPADDSTGSTGSGGGGGGCGWIHPTSGNGSGPWALLFLLALPVLLIRKLRA